MSVLRCLPLLFFSLLVFVATEGVSAPIRVGGDLNYPPYEFINEAGEPDGYNTELTRAIAEVMGIEVTIELEAWDEARKKLESGELDVLQGMVDSIGREGKYDFSPPHALVNQSVFARMGTAKIKDLSELAGKQVIVQNGGVMHDYLVSNDINAELILVDTHAQALRTLASGQYDYAVVANLPGQYLGKELSLTNVVPVGLPFAERQYGYAVLDGNLEILAQFSEGLAILKNTGRQQAIYDKWLGPLEAEDGFPWKEMGQITGVVSALLLFVLGAIIVWNRMLTSEVSRRAEELKNQQAQLMQADKMTSLGILVSGVAHEINNPSSLLLLNLPVLQDFYDDAEEILEAHFQKVGDFTIAGLNYSRLRDEIPSMMSDMLTGAQRIRGIVDDLKDFARESPPDLKSMVDLNETLKVALRLVDNTIRQSSLELDVHFASSLPEFYGNAQKIEQVIINLVMNACQASEEQSKPVNIRTYLNNDGTLCLEVKDHGRGIAPEHIDKLCDPFFTTRREQGGTGLGLSVSSRIIEEHGGRLEYKSAMGVGTTATMILTIPQE